MIFALYDNYPIVTSDTGTYISSGFTLIPPADRPIFYGLFIRLTSLGMSLWLTAFIQCFLLSYALLGLVKRLIPVMPVRQMIALVLFTSLLTIAGWYAGQIMPDIFVSVMILCAARYLVYEEKGGSKAILLAVLLLSVITHNSNYVIITLFGIAVFIAAIFIERVRPYLRKTAVLFGIGILAWLSLCTSNYLGGKGFVTSTSGHVFIMGKLAESGVLKTYLDKACPTRNYRICAYKDSIPAAAWQFHWDANSPLQMAGGWEVNKDEYNTIIRDIFSRPKYWGFIMYKGAEATARQMVLTNIDASYALPWMVFDEETSPYKNILQYYPHEINEFKLSRQNTKAYNIGLYNAVFAGVIVISILMVLLILPLRSKEMLLLYVIIGVLILLNALTTATLSSVNERLNSRVIWLLPMLNILFIYRYYIHKILSRMRDK